MDNLDQLNAALRTFRLWYNHIRPHQHLQGHTPAEIWNGVEIRKRPPHEEIWFSAWEGLLTGYYLRR
ncbi:MAG TPA: integrase core domain-containing protein [Gammaproteobacteria bacterium]|nr:integrase core domain-containing protein [Gammaproteobacteria bacterium]